MLAPFGEGCHPDRDVMLAAGATKAETQLGRTYEASRLSCRFTTSGFAAYPAEYERCAAR